MYVFHSMLLQQVDLPQECVEALMLLCTFSSLLSWQCLFLPLHHVYLSESIIYTKFQIILVVKMTYNVTKRYKVKLNKQKLYVSVCLRARFQL